jgi:ribosomal protein S18 acetylase RimI-like enzyme
MEIVVRRAETSDLFNLAVLKQQVWISTYATEGLIDAFSSYVLSEYSVENVSQSITDKYKLILLATINECLIGCAEILLSPKSPIASEDPCLEISTLYILERFQGVGIGTKLLAECERAAKQLGFNKVWLTVYYKNIKAIDFYAGQNFTHIGDTDFVLRKDKHKNYIMLKVLSEKG